MSAIDPATGETVDLSPDEYLDALASRVRAEHRRSKEALGESVDAYFAIGRCLHEARAALPSDQAFGAWFRAQEFGFTQQWAHVLRTAAEHEQLVRAVVTTQVVTGGSHNIKKAVQQVLGTGSDPAPKVPHVEPAVVPDDGVSEGRKALSVAITRARSLLDIDPDAVVTIAHPDDFAAHRRLAVEMRGWADRLDKALAPNLRSVQ